MYANPNPNIAIGEERKLIREKRLNANHKPIKTYAVKNINIIVRII